MKNKKVLITFIILFIVLISLLAYKFISYKKYSNLEITRIVYSYGGGFGTEKETATKTITINSDGSVIFSNSYNSLTDSFSIDLSKYVELTNYIKKRMSLFDGKVIKEDNATDGTTSHIIIETNDGEKYEVGGYMIIDKKYEETETKILDIVGYDRFKEYVNMIEKDNDDTDQVIVEVSYSYGGGYGTEISAASKRISINFEGTAKFTNSYNSYEKTIDIDKDKYYKLVDYINLHKNIFDGVNESKDIMDGFSSSLMIKTENGQTYKIGGYMVEDEVYQEIVWMIYDIVDREVFDEYVDNIK